MEEGMTGEFIKEQQVFGEVKKNASKAASAGGNAQAGLSEAGLSEKDAEESASGQEAGRDCAESFRETISATFPGKAQDVRSYSGLSLAYIGDVVYDLVIRTVVLSRGNRPVNDLHRMTVRYVSANAQSKMVQALMESFTEEETAVYKRGRNSKPHTTARNASVADYLKATGFEAVIGYLYLTNQTERMLELIKRGIELAGLTI